MQDEQPSSISKTSMKLYAIGFIGLITLVGGVIYFNDQTPQPALEQQPAIEPPQKLLPPKPVVDAVEMPPIVQESITPEANTKEIIETIESEEAVISQISEPTEEPTQQPPKKETPKEAPLPSLDNSDELFFSKVSQISWLPDFAKIIIKQELARNFVTFVDNVSRGDLALKLSPIKKSSEKFSIYEVDDEMYINSLSYERYNSYVDMINSINLEMVTKHLNELSPLLDEAYMELGYEQGQFITTLYKAIDEMLTAPIIRNPIKVIAPSAMYKYADPQLESLSDVQKLMLRIGPDNITKLRPKLEQIQLTLEELM